MEFHDEFKKIESGMGDLQVDIDGLINSGAITEAPDYGYTYGRNSKTWVPAADKTHEHDLDEVNNLVATLNYLKSQINNLEEGAIGPRTTGMRFSDINQLQGGAEQADRRDYWYYLQPSVWWYLRPRKRHGSALSKGR